VLILIALQLEFSGAELEMQVNHVYQSNAFTPMPISMMISSARSQLWQTTLELTTQT